MSLLTSEAPRQLCGVDICWDFRDMIRLSLLLIDEELPEAVRYAAALELFYTEPVTDVQAAWAKLLWFYGGGTQGNVRNDGEHRGVRLYDFEQDGDLIWAAFYAQYGIDLTEVQGLHWWKFRAMFLNLDEHQQISRIMSWRGVDTKGMSPKVAAEYKRLKRIWAIRKGKSDKPKSLEERDRRLKNNLDRAYARMKSE